MQQQEHTLRAETGLPLVGLADFPIWASEAGKGEIIACRTLKPQPRRRSVSATGRASQQRFPTNAVFPDCLFRGNEQMVEADHMASIRVVHGISDYSRHSQFLLHSRSLASFAVLRVIRGSCPCSRPFAVGAAQRSAQKKRPGGDRLSQWALSFAPGAVGHRVMRISDWLGAAAAVPGYSNQPGSFALHTARRTRRRMARSGRPVSLFAGLVGVLSSISAPRPISAAVRP